MNVKFRVLSIGAMFFAAQHLSAQQDTTKVQNIDEVVVVAYGTQKKSTLTGSNLQVGAKEIENRPISNALQALDGAGAGIQIAASSGQPGDSPAIRIRGAGSFLASNSPLIVVDGVPFSGNLNSINPNDIESLNVLKDAASTSLYGSSAANGVILVTTKRGKKNSSRVTLNSSTGIIGRFVQEYDRVGPKDYYLLTWESMRNGRLLVANQTLATANAYASANLISGNLKTNVFNVPDNQLVVDGVFNPNAQLKYNDFDWADAIMGTGLRNEHSISYSGGNDKSTFYSSLNYTNEEGYVIKSNFERMTLRLNADSQVKPWLKFGTSLNGSFSSGSNAVDGENNNASFVNPYRWTRGMGPIYSPYKHDPITGQRMYDADGNVMYDNGAMRGSDGASGRNVVWETLLNDDITDAYNIQGNVYAEAQILEGLTFRTNGSYNYRGTLNKTYKNTLIGDAIGIGSAARTAYFRRDFTWNQILTYNKSFGDHNFTLMGGHENFEEKYDYLYGSKRQQILEDQFEFDNFVDNSSLSSSFNRRSKEGVFGRVNYNYLEKYLLEGSIRWDGSSRFRDEVRWQSFWSAGAGWVISRENFMSGINKIDFLKLRASYGEVGNDNLESWYAFKSLYGIGYNNGTEAGTLLTTVADPDVHWETKAQSDVALEFELFDRRLKGTLEYYNSETRDLLFATKKPLNAGIPDNQVVTNIGAMVNRGYEVTISADVIRNQDLKWNITAFGSTYENEVTQLEESFINGTKKIEQGKDIYAFYLRTWAGVDPTDGQGLFVLDPTKSVVNATDERTVNGQKVTTNQNKALLEYQGSAIPDFFGNVSTTVNFRNWELSAALNYQFGGLIYDTNYAALMTAYPQGGALHTDMLNRWTTPGQITDVPVMNSSYTAGPAAASSRWLIDASYVMLRNATLGYNFNKDLIKSVGISSLKLFVSGENIWMTSKRKGLEPYQSFNGTTTNRYSPPRIVTFGLSTTF